MDDLNVTSVSMTLQQLLKYRKREKKANYCVKRNVLSAPSSESALSKALVFALHIYFYTCSFSSVFSFCTLLHLSIHVSHQLLFLDRFF